MTLRDALFVIASHVRAHKGYTENPVTIRHPSQDDRSATASGHVLSSVLREVAARGRRTS